ncbi:SDR family NAD(P)-dependent oxidoreductase [Actinomadura kijaniata]|uniref:SDR family NAD(P)-dependent oxidoreductase n=1 Tax=Actinomadura kijaniata TaxID=46161 RepID=UPI00082E854B|nr:SDR family oxidoreductase [Actinomadura kijaniata]
MSERAAFLVTGATGRLGGAVVAALAGRGDRVMLVGRNRDRLDELAKEHGDAAATFAGDATEAGTTEAAAAECVARHGRLDGLVHLVGGFHIGPVRTTSRRDYEDVLRTNFLSAVTSAQAVLPHLGAGGRMVFFVPQMAVEPPAAFGAYVASKAALLAWTRSFAHEAKHADVHVNTVLMTMADTPDQRRARPAADFGLAVAPGDVAKVVAFLTSDGADGLYGGVVPVLAKFEYTSGLAGGPPGGRPPGNRP